MQDLREHILGLTGAIMLVKSMTSVPEVLDGLMSSMLTLLNLMILSQGGKEHVQVSIAFYFARHPFQELFCVCYALGKTDVHFTAYNPSSAVAFNRTQLGKTCTLCAGSAR